MSFRDLVEEAVMAHWNLEEWLECQIDSPEVEAMDRSHFRELSIAADAAIPVVISPEVRSRLDEQIRDREQLLIEGAGDDYTFQIPEEGWPEGPLLVWGLSDESGPVTVLYDYSKTFGPQLWAAWFRGSSMFAQEFVEGGFGWSQAPVEIWAPVIEIFAFMQERLCYEIRLSRASRRRLQRLEVSLPETGCVTIAHLRAIDYNGAPVDEDRAKRELTHRFNVRAHPRRLDYLEPGRITWVGEHIKGPVGKPLIIKNRVMGVTR